VTSLWMLGDEVELDATRIAPRLYQGSRPPKGHVVRRARFDVLALCAEEIQPPDDDFPGVAVVRALLDDAELSSIEAESAKKAALRVAQAVAAGARVLVTCQAGRNRSGLVVGLALHQLTGWPGLKVVQHIRSLRMTPSGPALTNRSFAAALQRLRGRR